MTNLENLKINLKKQTSKSGFILTLVEYCFADNLNKVPREITTNNLKEIRERIEQLMEITRDLIDIKKDIPGNDIDISTNIRYNINTNDSAINLIYRESNASNTNVNENFYRITYDKESDSMLFNDGDIDQNLKFQYQGAEGLYFIGKTIVNKIDF